MNPSRNVQLGLIQMQCAASREQNLDRATAFIRQAAKDGAQIVCLPEIFLGPYFCQTEDHRNFELAEPVPGPSTDYLGALANELHVVIVASLFEKRAAGLYHNTSAVLDADGRYLGKYRKMHIPDDPLYFEKFYFTPGDLGFGVFETRFAKIGVLICWDQWYPEAARLSALQGAEVLLYPTAIGWHPQEKDEFGEQQMASWQLIQRSHAVANGCFVGSVNRWGHEGPATAGIEFWGKSFICDPSGRMLAEAGSDGPEVVIATLDLAEIDIARTHWPFLRDRRIDAYAGLTARYLDGDCHNGE